MYKIIQGRVELRLVEPKTSLKDQYLNMLEEWKEYEEELIPWSLNFDTSDFSSFVETLKGYRKGIGLSDGFVPCTIFWLINNEKKVLGVIEIRHRLTDSLEFRGGHIGYGIRPSERRKGYAGNMLKMALGYCKNLGLNKILITCSKYNLASIKTILKNGGVLDSEDIDNGEIFQRYWIKIGQ